MFWIGIAGFAVACLVALVVGKRRDKRREADRALQGKREQEFWTTASRLRAKILSSEQLGTVNLKPSFRLILRIEGPDGGVYPVETEQHVEFADVTRVAAGRTVDVMFDPALRDRVALCTHDVESADAVFDDRSEAKFMAAGECVPAEILSVSAIPTVSIVMPGRTPNQWLSLRVDAPGGSYEAQTYVSSVGIRPLVAGMKLNVWIDPKSRDRLVLQLSDIAAAS